MRRVSKTRSWARAHQRDPYVKQAKADGWRSRAALKLLPIQARHPILQRGMSVLDLGAAPGSWSQVASGCVLPGGLVLGVDRLPMEPLPGVTFIQGDLLAEDTFSQIADTLPSEGDQAPKVDVVLSDMAPNITGLVEVDDQNWRALGEVIFQAIELYLKKDGCACIKLFHNGVFRGQRQTLLNNFERVQTIKPDASKAQSREVYLLARGYHGIMKRKRGMPPATQANEGSNS